MMTAQALSAPRFIRKTTLGSGEYNMNFDMLDRDVIDAVSSSAADKVTPLMSKIYLRLRQAPTECREAAGVLRFEGEMREGKWIKAWDQLCRHLRVSSETASKALQWMHKEGIIGYSAFKNGVGIRIFLNRASSSIAVKPNVRNKRILDFAPASTIERPASLSEAAFNATYGVRDDSDKDLIPHAPQNGANKKTIDKIISDSDPALDLQTPPPVTHGRREATPAAPSSTTTAPVDEIVRRLKIELEPCVKAAAAQAAMTASAREAEQTRKWFEERALPKAVRVAQHETYNLFKKFGAQDERHERARADLQVGRATESYEQQAAHPPLTPAEISELAEMCIALLETQSKAIDETLSEISAETGGWLLAEDAPRIRDAAQSLLSARVNRR